MRLRAILVAEGAAKSLGDLPSDVSTAAAEIGYLEGLQQVVVRYKPAAAKRKFADGVNVSEESVEEFRSFSAFLVAFVDDNSASNHVQALLLHNAASGLSKVNGNLPEEQVRLNKAALVLLENVPEDARTDDWWVVYEKVMVGLMEADHVPFDETKFRRIIASMEQNGSKDTAGRRLFLANWLVGQKREDEATKILEPVENDGFSAPNQREMAVVKLAELRLFVRSPEFVSRGVSREHRAEATHKEEGGGDQSFEDGNFSRPAFGAARQAGSSFRTKEGFCRCPHHRLPQKGISFYWCFFVF